MSEPVCTSCSRPASDFPQLKRFANCGKCLKVGVAVPYCSRACQIANHRQHKLICGKLPAQRGAPPAFDAPGALRVHQQLLASLPQPEPPTLPPSFVYFPASPLAPSSSNSPLPTVVTLPSHSHPLFASLARVAANTGNRLSVNLMYSLLVDMVEQAGGTEARLIEQLSDEYAFDLQRELDEEDEPEEAALEVAVGGEEGMGALFVWQQAEAERMRQIGSEPGN